MASVSFDRAVEYYDQTRGFAPGVAKRVRDAIVEFTHADTATSKFLELGVGTGRIALPFIEAGYDFTGVDISLNMMEALKKKLDDSAKKETRQLHYHLEQADITQQLPFPDNTFSVVMAVHVLHLISDWQGALQEAKRVLQKPGGWLLLARDGRHEEEDRVEDTDPQRVVSAKWDEILKSLGVDIETLRPGRWLPNETMAAYLKDELKANNVQVIDMVEYERLPLSLQEMADRHKAKMYSGDWNIPENVHVEAVKRLQSWLDQKIGPEKANQQVITTSIFSAVAASW